MELYNKENAPPTIMNAFDLEFEKGIEKGIERGIEKGKIEGKTVERQAIAERLIIEKLPLEMIAAATGLTLDEVKDLQKTLN